ncbi:hypothetical protein [Capnocytophaga sputigena]|jgi:hypothetical protein|uniref:hypothetical protein n=1 Tax=Capnocytophaga sputigena TaxID=1019 RepID=UPI0028E8372D|nr:hypothetical protein [Capnocytophaga sputigena]
MTSEEIKTIVYYIQGLQALWKEGYNAEKVALYNYQFSLRAEMGMPDGLLDVIEMLEMWDDNWIYGAVPLTEKEAATIIQEELNIDIYHPEKDIMELVTKEFVSQLKDECSSNKIVAEALENSQELISYDEYLVALQNVLNELLTHHIRIPAYILAIIDVIEDSYIKRLQASLWGI